MTMIDSTEFEDYKAILRKHGYSEEDFELSEIENSTEVWGIQPVTGKVIITNIKSGIEKTYKAGHESQWVIDFEDDLKSNVFK